MVNPSVHLYVESWILIVTLTLKSGICEVLYVKSEFYVNWIVSDSSEVISKHVGGVN